MTGTPDDLSDISDPLERIARANQAMKADQRIRDQAIKEASQAGKTRTEIGDALGVTPQRVSQILKGLGTPGPERAFWGATDGILVVAVGGKTEAPKGDGGTPGPVVAVEDLAAFTTLKDAVEPLGIHACHEVIPPPGLVNLNRSGLVVVCGPRLSPLVAQVLAGDRNLAFAQEGGHWQLLDRREGKTLRSPMDNDEPSDIGYLGRLPRPDGQGTFIYIAGIHAAGAPGVIHYLTSSLSEVWEKVRERRFSCLIRCTFDPSNREVLTSERITDYYEGT